MQLPPSATASSVALVHAKALLPVHQSFDLLARMVFANWAADTAIELGRAFVDISFDAATNSLTALLQISFIPGSTVIHHPDPSPSQIRIGNQLFNILPNAFLNYLLRSRRWLLCGAAVVENQLLQAPPHPDLDAYCLAVNSADTELSRLHFVLHSVCQYCTEWLQPNLPASIHCLQSW